MMKKPTECSGREVENECSGKEVESKCSISLLMDVRRGDRLFA